MAILIKFKRKLIIEFLLPARLPYMPSGIIVNKFSFLTDTSLTTICSNTNTNKWNYKSSSKLGLEHSVSHYIAYIPADCFNWTICLPRFHQRRHGWYCRLYSFSVCYKSLPCWLALLLLHWQILYCSAPAYLLDSLILRLYLARTAFVPVYWDTMQTKF